MLRTNFTFDMVFQGGGGGRRGGGGGGGSIHSEMSVFYKGVHRGLKGAATLKYTQKPIMKLANNSKVLVRMDFHMTFYLSCHRKEGRRKERLVRGVGGGSAHSFCLTRTQNMSLYICNNRCMFGLLVVAKSLTLELSGSLFNQDLSHFAY